MPKRFTVKAPAVTSNMGPGYDCMGMALDIWDTIDVEVGEPGYEVHGEGEGTLDWGPSNLLYRCFRLPFEESEQPVPEITIRCQNDIPLKRGLGSSSATIVGGLLAGNELCGRPLTEERLLHLAAEVEGHPDGVAPVMLGGCQIVVSEGQRLITIPVPVPEGLKAVVFIPDVPITTKEARAVLPSRIDRGDVVYNLGRVAMLVEALTSGDLTHLAVATGDRVHQPPRAALFPAMPNIFRAALNAGASGVFLSGAGPSITALTLDKEMTIGYEMADAAAKSGLSGIFKVLRPSTRGAHVIEGN